MGHEPQTPWSELLRCSCQSHNCNRGHAVNPQQSPSQSPVSPLRIPQNNIIIPSPIVPSPASPVLRPRPRQHRHRPLRPPTPRPPPVLPSSPDETLLARPGPFRQVGCHIVERSYGQGRSSAISHQIFSTLRAPGSQQRAFTPTVQPLAFALSAVGTPACRGTLSPCTRALRPQPRHARARSPVQPQPLEDVLSLQAGHLSEEAIDEDPISPAAPNLLSVCGHNWGTRPVVRASQERSRLTAASPGLRAFLFYHWRDSSGRTRHLADVFPLVSCR
ncbi:hypothetical protein V8D89_016194 [Ganoderma adspersum]